jgi:hypothetical protein
MITPGGGSPEFPKASADTDIGRGGVMAREHVVGNNRLFTSKLTELGVKPYLTDVEVEFIDAAAIYGARNIIAGMVNFDMHLSPEQTEAIREAATPLLEAGGELAPPNPILTKSDLANSLGPIAAGSPDLRVKDNISNKPLSVQFALQVLSGFSEMVLAHGQPETELYLAQNIRMVFDKYAQVEKQPPQI